MSRPADPSAESTVLGSGQAAAVREHLRELTASSAFAGSKRAQEFLELTVEHALAGRVYALKERMIGAEMFGRPVDYDTANDAVVRVKATEVRRRLAQYYRESAQEPVVRIELPVGSYVPKFVWAAQAPINPSIELAAAQSAEAAFDRVGAVPGSPSTTRSRRHAILLLVGASLLAAAVYFGFTRHPPSEDEARSLAILPLVNLSGDPGQEYFADGMTEELIAEMGRMPTLRVISRTSAMAYKGTKKQLPEISRELQVDRIVEGSIVREGNRVRIIAQLIDPQTDKHLWAHTYDRDITSVLELQSEVARAISDEIQIELTPQQRARFSKSQHANPEALELYLQGMQRLNSGNPKDAVGLFRASLAKDPSYAAAHAALADAYGWLGEAGWSSYAGAFSQQKAEAQTAIELDDTRPEPHLNLGIAAMNQDWDWATERKELQRALELGPNTPAVRWAYASYLSRIGRADDAIAQAKIALQLDPVSSRSFMSSGFIYYYAHQYGQALAQIQRAMALNPDPRETHFPLGVIYVEKGRYDLATEEFRKLGDVPHALGHLGNAYARESHAEEARALIPKLREHVDRSGVGRYEIALIYAALGEADQAFDWMEKAYQVRDKGLTYLKVDPCVDPLRSDPRFSSLVARVGFPVS